MIEPIANALASSSNARMVLFPPAKSRWRHGGLCAKLALMDDAFTDYDATSLPDGLGLVVNAQPGNLIRVHREPGRPHLSVWMMGTGNILTLGANCNVEGAVRFEGAGNRVVFNGGNGPQRIQATVYDADTLVWGRHCTAYGVRIWVHGGRTCEIGDGCLFSESIQIRTTDHHSIIDLATFETLNHPADVKIGSRVWLGEGVSIGKGVTVGSGAIVGSRSLVNRSVPPNEMWAGVPAKKLRGEVSWIAPHPCTAEQARSILG